MTDETVIEEEVADEVGHEEKPTEGRVESIASEMGWAPEDQWRGDPDKWVDAETFIRNGAAMHKRTLQRQDGELADLRKTLDEFKGHYQRVEETTYKRAKAELEAERQAAAAKGDAAGVERIQGEIDDLPEPQAADQQGPENDPVYLAFKAENQWYDDNYEMTDYAVRIAPIVANKGFAVGSKAFYDEIARATKEKFDRPNPQRRRPSSVEGAGGTARAKKNGKSYEDLPTDAKAACDRFVAQGMLTKEEYVKDYQWDA